MATSTRKPQGITKLLGFPVVMLNMHGLYCTHPISWLRVLPKR